MSYPLSTKSCGQGVEQPGVGRRVGQREVVDRVDEADAEVVRPDAVDEAAGEERVVRRRAATSASFTRGVLAGRQRRSPGRRAPWASARGSVSGFGRAPAAGVGVDEHLADQQRSGCCSAFGGLRAALGVLGVGDLLHVRAAELVVLRTSPARRCWRRPGSRPASSGRTGACGTGRIRAARRGTRPRPSRPTARSAPAAAAARTGRASSCPRSRSSNPFADLLVDLLDVRDPLLRRPARRGWWRSGCRGRSGRRACCRRRACGASRATSGCASAASAAGCSSACVLLPVMSQNLVAHRAACSGCASSSSIIFSRFFGSLSARNARTSSGVGSWPMVSMYTRRRNFASRRRSDGTMFSSLSLAKTSRSM